MSWTAVAIVGSSLISGYFANQSSEAQSDSATEATEAVVEASDADLDFQREVFEQQREDTAPWREAGAATLQRMQEGMDSGAFDPGEFKFHFTQDDPSYQFRLNEGVNALDRGASARGRLSSGAQDKAITRFGQGLASQEYGNAFNRALTSYGVESDRRANEFNRLAGLSGTGQISTGQIVSAGNSLGGRASDSLMASGNALASGARARGDASASAYQGYAGAINQGIQNYLTYAGQQNG